MLRAVIPVSDPVCLANMLCTHLLNRRHGCPEWLLLHQLRQNKSHGQPALLPCENGFFVRMGWKCRSVTSTKDEPKQKTNVPRMLGPSFSASPKQATKTHDAGPERRDKEKGCVWFVTRCPAYNKLRRVWPALVLEAATLPWSSVELFGLTRTLGRVWCAVFQEHSHALECHTKQCCRSVCGNLSDGVTHVTPVLTTWMMQHITPSKEKQKRSAAFGVRVGIRSSSVEQESVRVLVGLLIKAQDTQKKRDLMSPSHHPRVATSTNNGNPRQRPQPQSRRQEMENARQKQLLFPENLLPTIKSGGGHLLVGPRARRGAETVLCFFCCFQLNPLLVMHY